MINRIDNRFVNIINNNSSKIHRVLIHFVGEENPKTYVMTCGEISDILNSKPILYIHHLNILDEVEAVEIVKDDSKLFPLSVELTTPTDSHQN